MIVSQSTHWTELLDALQAVAPLMVVAVGISAVILGIVIRPPARMRPAVAESRRQLVIAAAGIPIGVLSGFAILYWML